MIIAQVITKLFHNFEIVFDYSLIYQKISFKIGKKLANMNGRYNQNNHYKIFVQVFSLKKLLKIYALLVATIDMK